MSIKFPSNLKEMLPNAYWDVVKIILEKIRDFIYPTVAALILPLIIFVWNFWKTNPTFQMISITFLVTNFIWLVSISIFYLIKNLRKARNEEVDRDEYNPIGNDNEEQLQDSSYLVRGYLDKGSTLSHDVKEEVEKIKKGYHEIIPTKYLFAHAESYNFYNLLKDNLDYKIQDAKELFLDRSRDLADSIENIVNDKKELTIISLGIGFAEKEEILLRRLRNKKININMVAIDINPSFINHSLKILHKSIIASNIDYRIVIGDFDNINNYDLFLPPDRPILFLALGGIFGNQNEQVLLDKLKKVNRGEKYLLIDFQTKDSLETKDKGGYDSDANKIFIKNIIRVFCDDTIEKEKIRAEYYRNLPKVKATNGVPSEVPKSETIVMVGESNKSGKLYRYYVGYSTRYEKESLKRYLLNKRKCKIIKEFDSQKILHTWLFLCKL